LFLYFVYAQLGYNGSSNKGGAMRKALILGIVLLFGCVLFMGGVPANAQAKNTFVTIGTGGITGLYYPTGGAIAQMVNKKREKYGIRCTVEATGGSVFNINAVMAGDLEFGVVQHDRQYQAVNGLAEWQHRGPQKDLRAVFSIHYEAVTLVAAVDAGIKTIKDLKGKRVNIGNHGSGQRQNAIDALTAAGINFKKDIKAESAKAAEAPGLLQDGRLDAFFYTVGHPSGAIIEATAGRRRVNLVPLAEVAEKLIAKYPNNYIKVSIPINLYPSAKNDKDIPTFGVQATFITSANVPDNVVYAITKEVFNNFKTFQKLQPSFQGLTKEIMLESLAAPIHPGAMKYYQEVGLK